MAHRGKLPIPRSKSESMENDELPELETPVMANKGSGRLGSLFRKTSSIFEMSPFLSPFASGGTSRDADPDNQRAMKIAFYNTAAFVFVSIIFYTTVQVFYILEFCIRPLLFALLFGAVIYPLKTAGKEMIVDSLDILSSSGLPLVIGILLAPFYILKHLTLHIYDVTVRTYKEMIISLVLVFIILITDMVDIIDMASDVLWVLTNFVDFLLELVEAQQYAIWTLAVAYLIFVWLWWEPGTLWFVEWIGAFVWVSCLATGVTYFDEWRDVVALCVIAMLACGTYARLSARRTFGEGDRRSGGESGRSVPKTQPSGDPSLTISSTPNVGRLAGAGASSGKQFTTPATAMKSRYQTPATSKKAKPATKFLENQRYKVSTEGYFSVLGWSVVFTVMTRDVLLYAQITLLFALFILLYLIYRFLNLKKVLISIFKRIQQYFRQSNKLKALCPRSVRGLGILMIRGQDVVIDVLRQSTNQVVSGTIVIILLLLLCLVAFFIFYTVHSEILYLLQATSYFINNHLKTLDQLPSFNNSLASWSMGLSSVHTAGRSWIKSKVSLLPESDSSKELEVTLLSLYDDMYGQWIHRNVSSSRSNVTFGTLLTTVKGNVNVLSLGALKTNLLHLVSGTCLEDPPRGTFIANYILCSKGVILEVVNSLWQIISTNMTLVMQVTFSVMSGIVEGGAAFLNFVVQFVIFITALYYLLLYSDQYYAPVEFLTSLLPSSEERVEYTAAFFDATRGIFGASFKLSVFYGCYVWMTHTLFGLEIRFVPALLASLLSVIPVVGVYWASVPGVLVLWLVDGRHLRALIFLVLQIVPSYIVDMAIYSEIKGGWHPYITGLAVVGGLYYFGLEGAIIGPLVICILKFTINLYESLYDNATHRVKHDE